MTLRRSLLALCLIAGAASCNDPASSGNTRGFGNLALNLVLPPSLSRFSPSLVLTQVKVVISRDFPSQERSEPIDSTTVLFSDTENTSSARFRLLVTEAETLSVRVDYSASDGTLLFEAFDQMVVRPGATIPSPALQPFYVGPGSNIVFISLSPFDSVLSGGDQLSFDPQPGDANQTPVPQFYISWATDDPRVPIDARGHIVAPVNLTKRVTVRATAPNGVMGSTTLDILGPEPLGISPDSLEMLPGGQQVFRVTVGATRSSQFVWSVNGVDGGDATFGTINVDGFYQAPATTPSPASFKVCARDVTANTPTAGCGIVVIRAVPSVGSDVVVINDENIFDLNAMNPDSSPGNGRFVRNLVNFHGTGTRADGNVVWYDRGRNSPCFLDGECGDVEKATLDNVIKGTGKTIVKFDGYSPITSIPPNVKVIIFWMPLIAFTSDEIILLKRFAAEGGRIVFIGEHLLYYGQAGLDLQNSFLAAIGSQLQNVGDTLDCRTGVGDENKYFVTPKASLATNPLLTGVASLRYVCASRMVLGPNDSPLFFDVAGVNLLAGISKIDLTAIPSTGLPAAVRRIAPSRTPGIDGATIRRR